MGHTEVSATQASAGTLSRNIETEKITAFLPILTGSINRKAYLKRAKHLKVFRIMYLNQTCAALDG